MKFIADLHVHSHYSRATSKASHLQGLAAWALVKGIQVVGTGDFTHPAWFAHLHAHLMPAEPGFFRLKPDAGYRYQELLPPGVPLAGAPEDVRFILSAEISSIYKRGGKVRKVHNLLYVPDFESAQRVNATLATIGNISSDGRPILGLDSRDLLEILLEKATEGFLVPAHIWTPWFSLFGSKSGFDSIEECFGDLSQHVFALETGLSSDPEMNRMISALDRFTLISNSDCHSPGKLGREANIFNTDFSYFSLRQALRNPVNTQDRQVFEATIEFYPEEGKYHCDGHRKCGVCLEPPDTRRLKGLCPTCDKPLTVGVLHRVMELADRAAPVVPAGHPKVHSLIPLQEIVGELLDVGPASKKVIDGYGRLISAFGSEFQLLLQTPVEEIKARGFSLVAEAVARVRENRVIRRPGYDGEFGVIKVFAPGERATLSGQGLLFGPGFGTQAPAAKKRKRVELADRPQVNAAATARKELNSEQQRVVDSKAALILVQAGPGTGKTHTLVQRVVRVVQHSALPCTVITFTNKAAAELRARLVGIASPGGHVPQVATFHGYCLAQLRRNRPELQVVGPTERKAIMHELFPELSDKDREALSCELTAAYRQTDGQPPQPQLQSYHQALARRICIDLDGVVPAVVEVLRKGGAEATAVRAATGHLFVDEFQDVNQVQYELVALLAQSTSVFAIGDPDQAIYGFRGSDPSWFYAFRSELKAESHQLVRNYRSGSDIIRAAEQLISHNPHPVALERMQPCAGQTGVIYLKRCDNPASEAAFIADQVEAQVGGTSHRNVEQQVDGSAEGHVTFRDIGILYRTSRQAQALGAVLSARGIPFQLVDIQAYYTRGDCRLLYFWMLLLAELADMDQLLSLLEQERGMGQQSLQHIQQELWQASSKDAAINPDLIAGVSLAASGKAALSRFRLQYEQLRHTALTEPATAVLDLLMCAYDLNPQQPEMNQLHQAALALGGTVASFAAYLQTFSDSILYDQRAEAVTLSTLHAAKGLEFSVVFIAGIEQGLLPLVPRQPLDAAAGQRHLEEERRLFFVGMTRAISSLYLSWCGSRTAFNGRPEDRQPSPFLAELPPPSLSPVPFAHAAAGKRQSGHRQLTLFS